MEDVTADVMAECGLFGHFLIANSQNQMRERDIEEAINNSTITPDGKPESDKENNILSAD